MGRKSRIRMLPALHCVTIVWRHLVQGSHLSMVWCIWMTYRILFHLSGLGCRVERCETEHIRQVHDFSFSNGRHQIFIRRRIKLTLIGLSTSPV